MARKPAAEKEMVPPRRGGSSRERLGVGKPSTPRRRRTRMLQPQAYVGIDLHRRRSVIVQRSTEGETLAATQVLNDDTAAFARAVSAAGEHPEVVIEACYGWYWAVDLLEELGCSVHLAHPLGNAWGNRRVKNDLRDAEDLVDLWPRTSRRGLDRTQGDPRAPRAGAPPSQARRLAHELQAPGLLGARQGGGGRPDGRPVRRGRTRAARRSVTRPCLRGTRRVARGTDRGFRCPDHPLRARRCPRARRPRRPPRHPGDPRSRTGLRRDLRGRDRRRDALHLTGAAVQLGRAHAETPRVRHDPRGVRSPSRALASCAGQQSRQPSARREGPSSGRTSPASPRTTATPGGPGRWLGSLSPGRSSRSSTTA